jgi:NAD+ kinase
MLKDPDLHVTKEISRYLIDHGKQVFLNVKDEAGHVVPGTVPEGIDVALVLGGDGTLIRAARDLRGLNIPLLGINLGTLGYLTEVERKDYKEALQMLFHEQAPYIEERMMISGTVPGRMEDIAMNDIVLVRDGNLRIVNFDIYVNGELLNHYSADGVIISTPTGSTGYNLSAGGPIVAPTASILVITLICSHSLNTSSIVLSAEDEIEVRICSDRYGNPEQVALTFDGAGSIPLITGEKVVIRKSTNQTKLIKLGKESFMRTMYKKMKGN